LKQNNNLPIFSQLLNLKCITLSMLCKPSTYSNRSLKELILKPPIEHWFQWDSHNMGLFVLILVLEFFHNFFFFFFHNYYDSLLCFMYDPLLCMTHYCVWPITMYDPLLCKHYCNHTYKILILMYTCIQLYHVYISLFVTVYIYIIYKIVYNTILLIKDYIIYNI
jgi:hypothetical protein